MAAGLFVDAHAGDVEMIFCDPISRHEAVRHAHVKASPAPDPPVAMARHVVDLLRAGLLDFAIEALRLATRPPPEPNVAPPPRRHTPEPDLPGVRGAIESGAGVLVGFGGLDPSITPLVRLRLGLTPWLQLRLTGAGLGSKSTVETTRGSATVSQTLGVVDAAFTLAPSSWLRPLVVLGAGVYAASLTGMGQAPYTGLKSSGAAFAMDGGVGLAPWITPHLNVALEAHLLFAVPALAVRFVDDDSTRLGQPMLLTMLSFGLWI
jgi:hypothetical protein